MKVLKSKKLILVVFLALMATLGSCGKDDKSGATFTLHTSTSST